MKPEPLKGKIIVDTDLMHWGHPYVDCDDLRAAVEWLRFELTDLYHSYGKSKVWGKSPDVLCDDLEEFVLSKIDEAFADVVKKEEGK